MYPVTMILFFQANTFDCTTTKQKTLLKQFSRWLVAVYDHTPSDSRSLSACADDLDNVVVIAFPKYNTENSVSVNIISCQYFWQKGNCKMLTR